MYWNPLFFNPSEVDYSHFTFPFKLETKFFQ